VEAQLEVTTNNCNCVSHDMTNVLYVHSDTSLQGVLCPAAQLDMIKRCR